MYHSKLVLRKPEKAPQTAGKYAPRHRLRLTRHLGKFGSVCRKKMLILNPMKWKVIMTAGGVFLPT